MRRRGGSMVVALLLAASAASCTGPSGGVASSPPAASAPITPSAASPPPSTTNAAGSSAGQASTAQAGTGPASAGQAGTGPASTGPAVSLRVVPLAPGVSDEASGIAASGTRPGVYFLVDDGGGTDDLVAVDEQGSVLTRVQLTGMSASNAEALTAGSCGPLPAPEPGASTCLYVGDIGDNRERRADVVIYRVAEPDLAAEPAGPGPRITAPADEWRYTYPDGPHNAESMLLAPDGSPIIVTKPKNNAAHRIYRGDPGGGAMTFVREFQVPGSQRPLRTVLTGNVATDLAATPGRVLLLTYDDVHEYAAPDPTADPTGFPDWPHRSLPLPQVPQAEGIAGSADGCGYVVASEAGPGGTAGALGVATCG